MIEDAFTAFQSVYLCKLLHHYGRLDELDTGWNIGEDLYWHLQYEALGCVSDAVWLETFDAECKYYFSSRAMMEYYRLCRVYCRRLGMKLEQNPFMRDAERYIDYLLGELPSYGYGWTLLTKINHDWASGIVLGIDEQFGDHHRLIEALLRIFEFYEAGVGSLKSAIAKLDENKTKKEAA